ncbi:acyltransferase [Glaciihabitans sp. UYNi722]|uniref:acyltransferase family protein n=1 Tax=Glaciihabitans sp. UYNi722 TaxID=3156344 RepID=UPI003393C7D7
MSIRSDGLSTRNRVQDSAVTPVRRPGYDVLRGLAIALVLLRHTWDQTFPGAGIVGVVVFFTLSGYLITGILDREVGRTSRISFSRFYMHRVLRLYPALLLMLIVFTVVESILNVLGDRAIVPQTVGAAMLYLRDFPLPFATSPAINTLWTLAVEEQFYLVWPALFLLAMRRKAINTLLLWAFVTLVVLCTVSALIFARDPATIYILPTTWSSTIVVGAAAYIHRDKIDRLVERSRVIRMMGLVVAVGALLGLSIFPDAKNSLWLYLVGGPLIAVLTVLLISICGRWSVLPTRFLEPLRLLGIISYAVYAWNALILDWLRAVGGFPHWVEIPSTILVAILSWITVEAWGRRARRRFDVTIAPRPSAG